MKDFSRRSGPLFLFCILILFASCTGGDEDDDSDSGQTPADDTDASDDTAADDTGAETCDATHRPIVFVHGFIENGDAFATQAMRFASNGYCMNAVHTYDWNTIFTKDDELQRLAAFVDDVLESSGASQADLLGHSMGGGLGYDFISDEGLAAKTAHYAHIASFAYGSVPNGVPTIVLSSEADTAMGPTELSGAQNVVFDDLDHLQVAASAESFEAMYRFFNDGEEPATTEIIPEDEIELSGRVVLFGFNDPLADQKITVYAFDPGTGERLTAEPDAEFRTDPDGYWGTFRANPDTYYEFVCEDADAFWPPVHYYRQPFPRSSDKVYFRMIPPKNHWLGYLFRILPFNDEYALFAWLNVNQAAVYGRDTFSVNGIDLATEAVADASNTTLAVFFFDANFNGASDEAAAGGLFASIPFMRVFDLLIGTDEALPISMQFNGQSMAIPNWKSRSEGVSIAVFE